MRLLALLLAALASTFGPPCAAAPFAVQLGDTRIGLDAPPGFADTVPTGSPRLQELGESLTSASNRILLFAISDADLRRFTVGDPPEFRRYMITVTPRGMERDRLTESQFRAYVGDSTRELGRLPPDLDYPKHLETLPYSTPGLLAELRKDADVVSVLQGVRTRAKSSTRFSERSQYHLTTTTLMLVRGKALNLIMFTSYDDPSDLDWIRATTARWIDEIKRLNPR